MVMVSHLICCHFPSCIKFQPPSPRPSQIKTTSSLCPLNKKNPTLGIFWVNYDAPKKIMKLFVKDTNRIIWVSILGYPYFWKHPYPLVKITSNLLSSLAMWPFSRYPNVQWLQESSVDPGIPGEWSVEGMAWWHKKNYPGWSHKQVSYEKMFHHFWGSFDVETTRSWGSRATQKHL